uniref:(northern house mosquito) hypothetical protein n=1 Tax=Culex pipiens TaxID=7175 RepID=A0A8D8H4C5_CULPI
MDRPCTTLAKDPESLVSRLFPPMVAIRSFMPPGGTYSGQRGSHHSSRWNTSADRTSALPMPDCRREMVPTLAIVERTPPEFWTSVPGMRKISCQWDSIKFIR